MSEDKLT